MWERFARLALRLLLAHWVTLLLFAILVSLISVSLDEANWVSDDGVFLTAFNLGLLFGLLLARSRFPGWFAALYAVLISAFTALETVGKIIPSPASLLTTPLAETVNTMNLRAFELNLRAAGWLADLRAGETIQDTGLFIILLCFVLGLCAVWLVWAFVRRRNALAGLLPVGLLFAVNVHLSRQPLLQYAVFLACALLLIARAAFIRQHEEWQRRRVDFPDQLGLEWGGAASALALAVVIIARAAPVVGTPQGWQAIADWVASYQEQTEETAERLFGGVNPPPAPAAGEPRVSVNTPNMSEIGGAIPQGYQTVMWVSTSDPPPPPPQVAMSIPDQVTRVHYWRSGIYSAYTGRGWEEAALQEAAGPQPGDGQPETLIEDPPDGRYALAQRFTIEARHTGTLFSVNEPVLTGEGITLRETSPDGSRILEGQVEAYEVTSLATRVTANQLISAPPDYPPEIQTVYLQLPESLPGRVRALAERVVSGAQNSYQKALAVQAYLRVNYPYDMNVRPAPDNRDLVDYFLFDLQEGYCSHYASAMAVMLRSVDVPARVVTGYAMGEYDIQRGAYRVPVSASHAWVEVYFPGYGWIEFEPTAYRPPIEYPEDASAGGQVALPPVVEDKPAPPPRPLFIALVVLGAGLLLALPFLALRLFRPARSAPEIQASALYRQMRRALGIAGLSAVPSVTPDEYLAQYRERLAPYGRLEQALRQATSLYRETLYSPRTPDQTRVRTAAHLWQRAIKDWLVLLGRTVWMRIKDRVQRSSGL